MALLDILCYPDPRLHTVAQPVQSIDDALRSFIADMLETMYAAPGIGLAAIQVGVPLRVLVIDLQPDDPDAEPVACDHDGHHHHHQPTKKEPLVFINPVLSSLSEDLSVYNEGCLSVPEIYAEVTRPSRIHARWQDVDGNVHEAEIDDLLAELPPVPPEKVLLMPLGVSQAELRDRSSWLAGLCLGRGWRLCPRLHIELYGHTRGT